MGSRRFRAQVLVITAAAGLAAAVLSLPGGAAADTGQAYSLATVGPFGGEPSITSDPNGVLYDTTPSGGTVIYRSDDKGLTWHPETKSDPSSGDDCVTTDQSGAVYECNLAGSDDTPLDADVWKSTDGGQTWAQGKNQVSGSGSTCGASCSPFGVDRDWLAASIPAGGTTNNAEVALMYHDFYGPSSIWVSISKDGGATYAPLQNVMAPPATTPGAISGTLEAEGYTFCSTVPAGVGIVPPGKPHAGRIIVGWIASDPVEDAAGCNVSQYETFHTLWVSYSDDGGSTWTPQLAYDGGVGHDASTPFVAFATDTQGNPYFGFAMNANANPALCKAEQETGEPTSLQDDPTCEYNMYVVWSNDAGATWDGGGGTIPGSAATPYQVNAPSETGTHWFPAIAAANPGQVDVAYLRTPTILPTGPGGKADPGGCAPASSSSPLAAGPCSWDLYAAQSTNLTEPPGQATWSVSDVTSTSPMHVGDICNLGIACVGSVGSNRNLLDFIQTAIDPTTGCAHIAYADDHNTSKGALMAANQTAGCFSSVGADLPEAPWTVLLLPVGTAAVLAIWNRRRRLRRG